MGGDHMEEVKFFESWSSIRSLYKHMYRSPSVNSVFRSEAFSAALADSKLEGPFKVCYSGLYLRQQLLLLACCIHACVCRVTISACSA